MRADLHIHSTHSDGSCHVPTVVDFASRQGLGCIAVTDHDTVAGVEEAARLGAAKGVRVLAGVEISARDTARDRPVHLLCYLPRDTDTLMSFCQVNLDNRAAQKRQMVRKLMERYPITLEDVLARSRDSGSIYECHIMGALADLGYTNTVIGPLMKSLLSPQGSCYVPSRYPDVWDAARTVRACGGILAVAHPGQFNAVELTAELAAEGLLDAVEIWHPRNSPPVRDALWKIVESYGLIPTGGSDFHGCYTTHPKPLGACICGEGTVNRLLALAESRW